MKKRILFFLLAFLILGGSLIGWFGYRLLMESNFEGESVEVLIDDYTELSDVMSMLDSSLIDRETFRTWAEMRSLEDRMKPGRYVFTSGMSNREMINRLAGGMQTPAKLQFHHVGDFADLAGELGKDLRADSLAFFEELNSGERWEEMGISPEMRLSFIVPNTYEVYWTASPEQVVDRLIDERNKFWKGERLHKAEKIGLTPEEVTVLASIVQKETYMEDEMSTVAGLYLNRLEKSIKLESDPTIKYIYEKAHPEAAPVTRVLFAMMDIDSPYNTYMYKGLPPGPLAIAEVRTIDAVLNAENHDYIFMCADPDRPGYHAFAKTLRQHARNRQRFLHRQWGTN